MKIKKNKNMSEKKKEEQKVAEEQSQQQSDSAEATDAEAENETDEKAGDEAPKEDKDEKIKNLEESLEKEKKEYLFLMAEFDNFRKRTLKEKEQLLKNGAESAMLDLLPVVDDFERAMKAIEDGGDIASVKEGVDLIYSKFLKYLDKNNVKAIDSTGKDFDTEFHEAVTMFPAPDEKQKGKVIDTVLKGYTINDKVLRHAKVVVGQ
jgi:molecular chaperone GrpE